MFIIIGQQSVFAEAKYSFKKISEKEFEAEFNDGEKITQIINAYFEKEKIDKNLYPIELVYSISSYHKLFIPHKGTVILVEFSQDLFPLTRNYMLELYYNSPGDFLNYTIICFDEPPKQGTKSPIEIKK